VILVSYYQHIACNQNKIHQRITVFIILLLISDVTERQAQLVLGWVILVSYCTALTATDT